MGAMMDSASRNVLFTLSRSLTESQAWAIGSFPAIIHRATGYSEQWAILEERRDEETGASSWRYRVQGLPDIDLVVDHIIHELTDAVLLTEWHSVHEDRFSFGSLRRDRPEPSSDQSSEQSPAPPTKETAR